MQNIVLDTNFIISALRFKVNMEAELRRICDFNYTISVLSGSLKELERLINESKLFEKRLASLALKFIKQKAFKIMESKGHVDDALLELEPKNEIIATQDAALKQRLRKGGFKIITIRQKKRLALEE